MFSASQRAADPLVLALENQIREGHLTVGEALPSERQLMADFGASRTVVREALRMLSARGLIDARPRHRPVVRQPGLDSALDAASGIVRQLLDQRGGVRSLFELRILIEAGLVRAAAQNATRSDLARLREALEANGAAVSDSHEFYETDMAFHGAFYLMSGNAALPAVHQAYCRWLAPQWRRMDRLPDRNRANHADHARILDAILMRDPDAAEHALRAHLDAAWDQVATTFGFVSPAP